MTTMTKTIEQLSVQFSDNVYNIFISCVMDKDNSIYCEQINDVVTKLHLLSEELRRHKISGIKYKYAVEEVRDKFLNDIRNYNGINIEDNYARKVNIELIKAIKILFS